MNNAALPLLKGVWILLIHSTFIVQPFTSWGGCEAERIRMVSQLRAEGEELSCRPYEDEPEEVKGEVFGDHIR